MMRARQIILLTSCLLGASIPAGAFAQDEGGGANRFGFGIQTTLTTSVIPAGQLSFTYDAGRFRIDGLLGILFVEESSTSFLIGGRFWYVVHQGKHADFAVGGGISLGFVNPDGPAESITSIGLEGGAQLRGFIADNFALTAGAGIGIGLGDGPFIFGLGGQLLGTLGVIYLFD